MSFLLDTDTCVWALRKRDAVVDRLRAQSPDDVFVASMSEAELLFGALRSRAPEKNRERVAAFLEPVKILPFDSQAAHHHASVRDELRAAPIGERDLVIASVALTHGLTLVTDNRREFTRVATLSVESWTQ